MARFAVDRRGLSVPTRGTKGPPGVAGPTGATGNGAVFTSVDSLHASPRAVTDWGPIINAAVAGGTRHFVFGPFDYPYSTMLDFSFVPGVYFEGAAGFDWRQRNAGFGYTRLIWQGTGAGNAIKFYANAPGLETCPTANTMRDIQFLYSSGSYTGVMIQAAFCGGFDLYQGCLFGDTTGALTSAAAAVSLLNTNTTIFEQCSFGGQFQSAVRGRETGAGFCNVVTFRDCTFDGGVTAAITNPGIDWLLEDCVFEFISLGAGAPMITTDTTYTGDQVQITLRNCAYWDAAAAGQKVVYAPAGNDWTFLADQCIDHTGPGDIARLYDMQGTGSIRITGGICANRIDFGDATTSTHKKTVVVVEGVLLNWGGAAGQEQLISIDSGHTSVLVTGNDHGPNYNGILRDGRARFESMSTRQQSAGSHPTIAAHSGITNLTATILGSDFAGIIVIQNTAGAPSATGLIVDVTINLPPANKGPTNDYVFPLVLLTPYEATSNVTIGTVGAQSALCHPYVHAAGGTLGSFSVGVQTAIPAGQYVQYAYQVVNLNGVG